MPARVWLEITIEEETEGHLVDHTIERTDLAFISDDEQRFFRPEDDVRLNANKFVDEYDPFSITMTTDLFHDDACKEIELAHQARPKVGV